MMTEDMQPVNAESGIPEEVRSSLQCIALQIACVVIHNHPRRCMAHIQRQLAKLAFCIIIIASSLEERFTCQQTAFDKALARLKAAVDAPVMAKAISCLPSGKRV